MDENGNILEKYILQKLNIKCIWLSEFSQLKKALPKEWLHILRQDNSKKTKVKTYYVLYIKRNCNYTGHIRKFRN